MPPTTTIDVWAGLRFFKRSEFKEPDGMDPLFLRFLDDFRLNLGAPVVVTSDGRSYEKNKLVGGVETSLHVFDLKRTPPLLARAIDFGIPNNGKPQIWEQYWSAVRGAAYARDLLVGTQKMPACGIELEIVHNPGTDMHIHLGLFRDNRRDRLVLALD